MSAFKNALKFITIAAAFVFFILLVFWGISASANGETETALLIIGASGDVTDVSTSENPPETTPPYSSENISDTTSVPETPEESIVNTTTMAPIINDESSGTTTEPAPVVPEVQSANINDYESNTTLSLYYITDSQGLEKLSKLVSEGVAFDGKTVALASNITVSKGFSPIGNTTSYFKGTFDGAGYAICGLKTVSTSDNAGLFTYINGATIKNVAIDAKSSVSGNSYVGSIVGYFASGIIDSCTNSGAVISTNQNSSSNVGGIAGYVGSGAQILNCVNAGSVSGKHSGIGGIAGQINGGSIFNCYNIGTVTNVSKDASVAYKTGGIFGYDVYSQFGSSAIANCYNAANVNCSSSTEKGGAIHGEITSTTNVYNCFYDTQYSQYGGTSSYQYNLYVAFYPNFTNINYLAGLTGMNASQMKSADLVERLNSYAAGNPMLKSWTNSDTVNAGYPYFGTNTKKAYSILITASAAGTVVSDKSLAYPGETIQISVSTTTNVSNYDLTGITVVRSSDGGVVSTTSSFTFVMPESDVVVSPIFSEKEYNISSMVNNTAGGVMTISRIKASAGTQVLIAATPTTGNEIEEIKVYYTGDNTKEVIASPVSVTGSTVTYSFTMPESDVTVSGKFVRAGTATTTTSKTTKPTVTTSDEDEEEELVPDDEDDDDTEDEDDTDDDDTTDDDTSDDDTDDDDASDDDTDDDDTTDDDYDDDDSYDDDYDDTDDDYDDTDDDDIPDDDDDSDAVIDDDENGSSSGGSSNSGGSASDPNPVTNVPVNVIGLTAAAGSALVIFALKRRRK
ncbi:MAG: hypothetical protein ACI4J1_00990 [Ruminiclostridium sp.]